VFELYKPPPIKSLHKVKHMHVFQRVPTVKLVLHFKSYKNYLYVVLKGSPKFFYVIIFV
jgi:hypothetical protein